MTITLEQLKAGWDDGDGSYDWDSVFAFAGDPKGDRGNANGSQAHPVQGLDREPMRIHRAHVTKIHAQYEGENDGASWEMLFSFTTPAGEDLYGYVTAGCDYTGWDCQAGGSAFFGETLAEVLIFGVGDTTHMDLVEAGNQHMLEGAVDESIALMQKAAQGEPVAMNKSTLTIDVNWNRAKLAGVVALAVAAGLALYDWVSFVLRTVLVLALTPAFWPALGILLALLVLFLACGPVTQAVACKAVEADGVHVQVTSGGQLVLDSYYDVQASAVDWWDPCGAYLDLEGDTGDFPVRVQVWFPDCD